MNWDKIIRETYTELYRQAEPSADFDKLENQAIKNDIRNGVGQFIIPFDDYLIDQEKMDETIESMIKKYKIRSYDKQLFKNTIYLGCSPKIKQK